MMFRSWGALSCIRAMIAEMNTGEGKTFGRQPCQSSLNALSGEGAILVTTNEYLAIRDAEEMGQVYEFLVARPWCALCGRQ